VLITEIESLQSKVENRCYTSAFWLQCSTVSTFITLA